MKILANAVSAISNVKPEEYSWEQSLRFFILGMSRACLLTLAPVAVMIGNWMRNWNTPIYWPDVWQLAIACAGPTALQYWYAHRHQLKLPPILEIPPEFIRVTTTTTEERSPHTTTVTTEKVEEKTTPAIVIQPEPTETKP